MAKRAAPADLEQPSKRTVLTTSSFQAALSTGLRAELYQTALAGDRIQLLSEWNLVSPSSLPLDTAELAKALEASSNAKKADTGDKSKTPLETLLVQRPWLTFLKTATQCTEKFTLEPVDSSLLSIIEPVKIDFVGTLRTYPASTASVGILGDWKRQQSAFTDSQKGQVMEAAQRLLDRQPRRFIYGFLASFAVVQFFRFALDSSGLLRVLEEPPRGIEDGAACLVQLLCSKPALLGFLEHPLPPPDVCLLGDFLGRGLSAVVYGGTIGNDGTGCVIKLARPNAPSDLNKESRVLLDLRDCLPPALRGLVPQVHKIDDKGFWSVLTPIGQPISSARAAVTRFDELVDLLQWLHTKGQRFHNDINPRNLLVQAGGPLLLIDWSAASTGAKKAHQYSPMYSCPAFLEQVQSGRPFGSAANDLHCLVTSFYCLLYPQVRKELANLSVTASGNWNYAAINDYWESKTGPWKAMRREALEVNYEELKVLLRSYSGRS